MRMRQTNEVRKKKKRKKRMKSCRGKSNMKSAEELK